MDRRVYAAGPICVPHFVPLLALLTAPLSVAHLQLFVDYDAHIAQAHASLAAMQLVRHSRDDGGSHVKTVANATIESFKLTSADGSDRMNTIISNCSQFQGTSETVMPTSWIKTAPTVHGMQRLDMKNARVSREVSSLCKERSIQPPSATVKKHSFHYGKYANRRLVSVLSLCIMNLNRTPGSIAISIDIAAAIDEEHSMSTALNSIKKMMRRRRNTCVLFTQCAQTDPARAFWAGKLTSTKRASVMTALFHDFDSRYHIYADADDMAIFFD